MALLRARTAEEGIERMRHGRPPTRDDVSILWDGRRLDSREAVMEWLAEVDAKRAEEAAARMPAPEDPIDGPPLELGKLVEALDRHGVEYLLVGGSAAGLHGAERPTVDADCVVRRDRTNLDRLAGALRELNGRLRVGGMTDAEARTLPVQIDGTALDMIGMSTWMTDAGPFDALAGLEAADGRLVPYEELAERAAIFPGDGFVIRTASIDDIIAAKEQAGRPKDREALPELRKIQEREHREATQTAPTADEPVD